MKFSIIATAALLSSATAFQTPNTNPTFKNVQGRNAGLVSKTAFSQNTVSNVDNYVNRESNTALSSALLPAAITSPIGSISVLAFVILIHEMGHFLAARSFDIKVKEFSIGVGPKIFGFTRGGSGILNEDGVDEEGIQFNLRAIPLGGYVAFPENYNATMDYNLEVAAQKTRDEIKGIIEENRKDGGEVAAATNGGLFSSFNFKSKDDTTEEERLAALKKLNLSTTMVASASSGSWIQNLFGKKEKDVSKERSIIIEKDGTITVPPTDYFSDPDLLQNRPWSQRAVVLVGGVVFNIILSFSLYFGELTVGPGLGRPQFEQGAIITAMPNANSASLGVLERGDVIKTLNGQALTKGIPTAYNAQDTISGFIENIRATNPGDSLHLSVLKASTKQTVEVEVTPKNSKEGDASSSPSIGIMIGPNYVGNKMVKATNPIEAASIAGTEVYDLTYQTARSITSYLGGLIVGNAPAGQQLSGPIGVIKTGSNVVSSNDITAVIGFAAAISVNLAVVNALPLPALDGGQLLFVLSEAVTGKKIDQKKQEAVTSTFLLFFLAVSLSTAVGDLSSLARFTK
mmetsp:Transcript_11764/g.17202  ORF Transcript_11764/g.17202 Transcript_11764/m.17202 type:complete len:572 (-) Transcript_11764:39-1754(-)